MRAPTLSIWLAMMLVIGVAIDRFLRPYAATGRPALADVCILGAALMLVFHIAKRHNWARIITFILAILLAILYIILMCWDLRFRTSPNVDIVHGAIGVICDLVAVALLMANRTYFHNRRHDIQPKKKDARDPE
jgi:hypothetical protein